MSHHYYSWELFQERKRELLHEAETNRLLKQAGVSNPKPAQHWLLAAVCVAVPLAVLIVRAVA